MAGFVNFMNGPIGRLLRVILGLVLIGVGLFVIGGPWGYLVALLGLVPLAPGLAGRCLGELFIPQRRPA